MRFLDGWHSSCSWQAVRPRRVGQARVRGVAHARHPSPPLRPPPTPVCPQPPLPRRKKKAKKYIQVATVRRPTGAAVAEAYFANSPAKTSYLRADALALLLSLANVGAHARVLVVETCGGLVTAAALERGGGVASAWAGGAGTRKPSLEIWRSFNFSEEQRAGLRFAPLATLLEEAQQARQAQQAAGGQQAVAGQQEQQQQQQQQDGAAGSAEGGAEPMQQDGQPQQAQQQPEQQPGAAGGGSEQPPAAAATAAGPQPPFNSCILAAPGLSPLALVRHVLPLLAPSASLAVYSPWPQPLAEALDALRGQGQVANLALSEAWWREMQVCWWASPGPLWLGTAPAGVGRPDKGCVACSHGTGACTGCAPGRCQAACQAFSSPNGPACAHIVLALLPLPSGCAAGAAAADAPHNEHEPRRRLRPVCHGAGAAVRGQARAGGQSSRVPAPRGVTPDGFQCLHVCCK